MTESVRSEKIRPIRGQENAGEGGGILAAKELREHKGPLAVLAFSSGKEGFGPEPYGWEAATAPWSQAGLIHKKPKVLNSSVRMSPPKSRAI